MGSGSGGGGGGGRAGLSHVVGLQQLLDGQAVTAPVVVHEQAVRHQPELGVGLRRRRVVDAHHGHADGLGRRRRRRLVVADGRRTTVVVASPHALQRLVVSGQPRDDRVTGQRVGVVLSRVLFVPPPLDCGNTQNRNNIVTVEI